MNTDEIDRVLSEEREIEPAATFHAQVMCAVHERAALGGQYDWIWRALWPAVGVTSVVVAVLIAATVLEHTETRPGEMTDVVWWLSIALTGTFATAWRNPRRIG